MTFLGRPRENEKLGIHDVMEFSAQAARASLERRFSSINLDRQPQTDLLPVIWIRDFSQALLMSSNYDGVVHVAEEKKSEAALKIRLNVLFVGSERLHPSLRELRKRHHALMNRKLWARAQLEKLKLEELWKIHFKALTFGRKNMFFWEIIDFIKITLSRVASKHRTESLPHEGAQVERAEVEKKTFNFIFFL